MNWNGEALATAIVGAGGAWMVGMAITGRGSNANAAQRRGLLLSGSGFLLNAASARWMQSYEHAGIACSLGGTMLAMMGMYLLVKERSERRAAEESDSRK